MEHNTQVRSHIQSPIGSIYIFKSFIIPYLGNFYDFLTCAAKSLLPPPNLSSYTWLFGTHTIIQLVLLYLVNSVYYSNVKLREGSFFF